MPYAKGAARGAACKYLQSWIAKSETSELDHLVINQTSKVEGVSSSMERKKPLEKKLVGWFLSCLFIST
jgi:hypothetical protein